MTTALRTAASAGALTVLNAAPARALPAELTDAVAVLVVNEQEAFAVAGQDALDPALELLLERVPEVVVTLGAAGAVVAQRGAGRVRVPAVQPTRVVDTTGAGDTFCGAYAAARARGLGSEPAAAFACAAASLSVEQPGAGQSAPTLEAVQARLARPAP